MGKKEVLICMAGFVLGAGAGIAATKKGLTDKAAKSLGLGKEEAASPVAQAQEQNQEQPVVAAKPMMQNQQKA